MTTTATSAASASVTAPAHAPGPRKHAGSCHCGAVTFEVEVELSKGVGRCNCSICTKTGVTGAIVKPAAFKLLSGRESLSEYRWGAKVSTRYFCKHCGIQCYGDGHLDELGGDFTSINTNCLDGVELVDLTLSHWDGRHDNWEAGPRAMPWPIRPVAPAPGS